MTHPIPNSELTGERERVALLIRQEFAKKNGEPMTVRSERVADLIDMIGRLAAAPVPPAGDDQWADLKAWAESLPPEYDVGKRKILEALAARAQPPVGEAWMPAKGRPDTRGHLWLALDANGKLYPGIFVNHRIPADATLVQQIVLPGVAHPAEPAARDGGEAWAELAKRPSWEVSFSGMDEEDGWSVHSVTGGVNDREWTELARADTPLEAVLQALAAGGEK